MESITVDGTGGSEFTVRSVTLTPPIALTGTTDELERAAVGAVVTAAPVLAVTEATVASLPVSLDVAAVTLVSDADEATESVTALSVAMDSVRITRPLDDEPGAGVCCTIVMLETAGAMVLEEVTAGISVDFNATRLGLRPTTGLTDAVAVDGITDVEVEAVDWTGPVISTALTDSLIGAEFVETVESAAVDDEDRGTAVMSAVLGVAEVVSADLVCATAVDFTSVEDSGSVVSAVMRAASVEIAVVSAVDEVSAGEEADAVAVTVEAVLDSALVLVLTLFVRIDFFPLSFASFSRFAFSSFSAVVFAVASFASVFAFFMASNFAAFFSASIRAASFRANSAAARSATRLVRSFSDRSLAIRSLSALAFASSIPSFGWGFGLSAFGEAAVGFADSGRFEDFGVLGIAVMAVAVVVAVLALGVGTSFVSEVADGFRASDGAVTLTSVVMAVAVAVAVTVGVEDESIARFFSSSGEAFCLAFVSASVLAFAVASASAFALASASAFALASDLAFFFAFASASTFAFAFAAASSVSRFRFCSASAAANTAAAAAAIFCLRSFSSFSLASAAAFSSALALRILSRASRAASSAARISSSSFCFLSISSLARCSRIRISSSFSALSFAFRAVSSKRNRSARSAAAFASAFAVASRPAASSCSRIRCSRRIRSSRSEGDSDGAAAADEADGDCGTASVGATDIVPPFELRVSTFGSMAVTVTVEVNAAVAGSDGLDGRRSDN